MARLTTGIKLQQKLSTQLKLGPQMVQSLNMLAMNSLDLEQCINQYLESNPLLERDIEHADESNDSSLGKEADIIVHAEGSDDGWDFVHSSHCRDGTDLDGEQQWHQPELSLHDKLHQQLECEPMDQRVRSIATAIVDSLDDDGYFRADPADISLLCASTIGEVWQVLCKTVQHFEPAGVGARDLSECLMLQLEDMGGDAIVLKVAEKLLLHEGLTLLESDCVVAKQLGCSTLTVAQARECLRRLDPSPGLSQASPDIYVYPELYFNLLRDGTIEVEVRRMNGSNIRLSNQWKNQQWSDADKPFIKNAEKEARWLLQVLAQRNETIIKVGIFLKAHQKDFLKYGVASIKPLTLATVAAACGVHESTVSRITNGKYAQTPLGLIELRHFFSAGIETRNGNMIAVAQVSRRIKHMIEKEPASKPLSDQTISQQLNHEGITIARRTIAKYREQLGFPSSSQRKKAQ
ncbi:MAG: RNA polymerase factor sigma-54 [Mariprofundaceae bacterium]|nr:RNA polymerase factor sigma-54 [Mariprofundaceae bacterium]